MRSDNVKKGPERAPNRSLFYALGYTPEELERPLIGVVSAYSEIVPGHMNLDKLADMYNEETGLKLGIIYLDHLSAKLFSMSGSVKDIMAY